MFNYSNVVISLPALYLCAGSLIYLTFYAWRSEVVEKNETESLKRIRKIEERIPKHLMVYFQFFLCDTLTGDKLRTPVKWLYDKAVSRCWFG